MASRAVALFLFLLIFGCHGRPQEKPILLKVNNYELTLEEFEEEYRSSMFFTADNREARKDFLENLINQKLILQDAQSEGLDKEEKFLKTIQRFWEQSLLKTALDKKAKGISGSVSIDENIVREAYDNMVRSGKTDKPFEGAREQIKWELLRLKETQLMNDWVEQLRKNAQIKINYDLLKQDKEVAK